MRPNNRIPGSVIRRERLARGIEQKALCKGICVPSYLSKIEHGMARPDETVLEALYERLGLVCPDRNATADIVALIDEGMQRVLYGLDAEDIRARLEGIEGIANSECAPDWLILLGWWGENTVGALESMWDCLEDDQRCQLELLRWTHDEGTDLKKLEAAARTVGTSHALNVYAYACYFSADYASVLRLEDKLAAQALSEGNTFQLAEYFAIKGSAYSCLFMDDMMMAYYSRTIHLLQNTAWTGRLDTLYYNIGATMLNLKRYDEADNYLNRAVGMADEPLMLHKRALLAIRQGDLARGEALLDALQRRLSEAEAVKPSDWLRLEEARWELKPDFLAQQEYLALLDRLLEALEREYHFGHVSFYQDVYLGACKRQRQYRKALEFQQRISSRSVRIIG